MKSLRNSVNLIGRLGKDPEVKMFGNNKKATFSIATTDSYKNESGRHPMAQPRDMGRTRRRGRKIFKERKRNLH